MRLGEDGRTVRSFWIGLVLALTLAGQVFAQGTIQQSGAITAFHAPAWFGNGVLADAGTPAKPYLNDIGLFNGVNCPFGVSSQTTPGVALTAYSQFSICQTASATTLSFLGVNGQATPSVLFNIGGSIYPFPGGNGNVSGPTVTALNDFACWNATTGTLLKDCGFSPTNVAITGGTISGTTLSSDTITGGTLNSTVIGGSTPPVATFAKLNSLNVVDVGATNGSDDAPTIQSAIGALSSAGGMISLKGSAYTVNELPNIGSKSIYWDFGVNTAFSGSATPTWPRELTNASVLPVGPWIVSQSATGSPTSPFIGATSAFSVETIQPGNESNERVGIYAGASSSSTNPDARLWATNFLMEFKSGFAGNGITEEIDLNNNAATGIGQGVAINGTGTFRPEVGSIVLWGSTDATAWQYGYIADNAVTGYLYNGNGATAGVVGFHATNSQVGVQIDTTGLIDGLRINGGASPSSSVLAGIQVANFGEGIYIKRKTDTLSGGNFLNFENAAGNSELFGVDINGNEVAATIVSSGFVRSALTTVSGVSTIDVSPRVGDTLSVSDATTCTANSTVTGGGSTTCALIYSGAAWKAIVTH